MPNVIALIATERTGTNYFCDLMGKSLNINRMYEIFHPDVPYGLEDALIAKALNKSFKEVAGLNNKEKARLVRGNPGQIVDGLVNYGEKDSLFKVFSGHLDHSFVKTGILKRPDIIKVIIDRSPLDVYISQQKAGTISKWGNVDTTGIKINLDRRQFDAWFKTRKSWYDFCVHTLKRSNQKCVSINYTDIETRTPEALVDFFIGLMATHGCNLTRSDVAVRGLMKKQDNSQGPWQKVGNWEQFKASFALGEIDPRYFSGFLDFNAG